MAEQKVPNQWQLQDTGESLEQWKLQDNEQRLPSHMELQDENELPELVDAAWQPIDYRAMQAAASGKSRSGGAALGALLVVALLAVGGYLAMFYMGGEDSAETTTTAGSDPAAVADASAPADTSRSESAAVPMSDIEAAAVVTGTDGATTTAPGVSAGTAPTAALASEALTPLEGTPDVAMASVTPSMIEVRQAVVNSPLGVNLRAAAGATGAFLKMLEDQSSHIVASGPTTDAAGGNWYELAMPDKTRGWVSGDYITVTVQTLPLADAEVLLAAVGITATTNEGTSPSAAPVVTTTAEVANAQQLVAGSEPTVRLTAVISAPAGLNLRRAAETGDNVIQLLESALPLTVIGRSSDGTWLQVELADKRRGWLASQFVSVTGDLATIPVGTSFPLTATAVTTVSEVLPVATPAASIATTETVVSATAPVTSSAPAAEVGASAAFTVTSIMGVNVRSQPSTVSPGIVQLSWNTSGQAEGRTADSEWVRVTIPSGQSGWVAAKAITLDRLLSTLPVMN